MKTTSKTFALFFAMAIMLVFQNCTSRKQTSSGTIAPKQRGTYTYGGGDGTSYENAVVILEKTSGSGIDAEYAWIDLNYPGNTVLGQALQSKGSHMYDLIEFKDANKKSHTVYFEIDNFFGKW